MHPPSIQEGDPLLEAPGGPEAADEQERVNRFPWRVTIVAGLLLGALASVFLICNVLTTSSPPFKVGELQADAQVQDHFLSAMKPVQLDLDEEEDAEDLTCGSFDVSRCPEEQPLLRPDARDVHGQCPDVCCMKACSDFDEDECPPEAPLLVPNASQVAGECASQCCVAAVSPDKGKAPTPAMISGSLVLGGFASTADALAFIANSKSHEKTLASALALQWHISAAWVRATLRLGGRRLAGVEAQGPAASVTLSYRISIPDTSAADPSAVVSSIVGSSPSAIADALTTSLSAVGVPLSGPLLVTSMSSPTATSSSAAASCHDFIEGCNTCSNDGMACATCDVSNGYYQIGGRCRACAPGCLQCSDFATCTKCRSSLYLSSGTCTGLCSIANCDACTAPNGLDPPNCANCKSNFFGPTCTACAALFKGCSTCSADGTACSACDTANGFYQTGSSCSAVECRTDLQCGSSGWCDKSGSCQQPLADGAACLTGSACLSKLCSSGLCTRQPCSNGKDCSTGQWCNTQTGLCNDLLQDFAPCLASQACTSGLCRSSSCAKVCSTSSACPAGNFCDDGTNGGTAGYCSDQLATSQPCTSDAACRSNHCDTLPTGIQVCVECLSNADCAKKVCDFRSRSCVPLAGDGHSCWGNGNAGCQSGKCASNICVECVSDSDCGSTQACDAATYRCKQGCVSIFGKLYCSKAAQPTPATLGRCGIANCGQCNVAGTACSSCYSGYGASVDGSRCVACPDDCTSCTVSAGVSSCTLCNSNRYLLKNSGTCTATCPIATCAKCAAATGRQATCSRCKTGYALSSNRAQCDVIPKPPEGGCTTDAHCAGSKWCDDSVGLCKDPRADGGQCTRGSACASGLCTNGLCVRASCQSSGGCSVLQWCNPTSGVCNNLLPDSATCTYNVACASGLCWGTCAKLCSSSDPCPEGKFCEDATNGGIAGYCSDQLANSQACTFDDACDSLLCGTLVSGEQVCVECKDHADCPAGHACDLASKSCIPQAKNGESCWGNGASGCLSGKCAAHVCVECLVDADCGPDHNCDMSTHSCKQACVNILGTSYCIRAAPALKGSCRIANCASCNASGTLCTSCCGGLHLSDDQLSCTACADPKCSVCAAGGPPCTLCDPGNYLASGQCISGATCPITNCAACQVATGGPATCARCSVGRYLSSDRFQCLDECPIANCAKCNDIPRSPATCFHCASGYVPSLDGLQCLEKASGTATSCTSDLQCLASSQWCDGSTSLCQAQLDDRQECQRGTACQSNLCWQGLCSRVTCTEDYDCNTGQWCNPQSGLCNNQLQDSLPCPRDGACASGLCTGTCASVCSASSPCPVRQFCDGGFCADLIATYQPCTLDTACLSGLCGTLPTESNVCVQCKGNADCDPGVVCDFASQSCTPKAANGASCWGNGHAGCLSGKCRVHTCVECLVDSDCATGHYCEATNFRCQLPQLEFSGGSLGNILK